MCFDCVDCSPRRLPFHPLLHSLRVPRTFKVRRAVWDLLRPFFGEVHLIHFIMKQGSSFSSFVLFGCDCFPASLILRRIGSRLGDSASLRRLQQPCLWPKPPPRHSSSMNFVGSAASSSMWPRVGRVLQVSSDHEEVDRKQGLRSSKGHASGSEWRSCLRHNVVRESVDCKN